jgi:mRNA interferase RelE/StbE
VYRIDVGPPVLRSLRKLPGKLQERLLRAAYRLEADARPAGTRKLAGQKDLYRLRVGEYRIVYHVNDADEVVTITLIAHRREVYRDL